MSVNESEAHNFYGAKKIPSDDLSLSSSKNNTAEQETYFENHEIFYGHNTIPAFETIEQKKARETIDTTFKIALPTFAGIAASLLFLPPGIGVGLALTIAGTGSVLGYFSVKRIWENNHS